MPRIGALILVLLLSTSAHAAQWVSPIDKKYQKQNPQLFHKMQQARRILDTWRGQTSKTRAAMTLLNDVLSQDIRFAPAYREYARAVQMSGYIRNSKYKPGVLERAENLLQMSIEIEPEYADAYVLLGHVYVRLKRIADAETALETAESIGTRIPWLHLNWGDLLMHKGRYTEALQRFRTVADSEPDNAKAYAAALQGITDAYVQMKRYVKAKSAYERRLNFQPESAWEWGNYASFLLFTYGDVDLAIEKARVALALMDYGTGRYVLACALYTKWAFIRAGVGHEGDAEQYFREAWSLYPYPETVIDETALHPYTQRTAKELRKWQERQGQKPDEEEQAGI